MKYSREKIKDLTGEDIKEPYGYIEILTEHQFKTKSQNKLFHALLDCFWDSGCSSFISKQEMRWHYKQIAHLIETEYFCPLDVWTKECIWKAIKILPIEEEQRRAVVDLLKGKVIKEHSWGEACKDGARMAIDAIIRDMDSSGVITSKKRNKYQEILRGINQWWE